MAASIANTYQESFRSTVLPSFERSCTEMMKQVDENFRRGTQDCKFRSNSNPRPDIRLVQKFDSVWLDYATKIASCYAIN